MKKLSQADLDKMVMDALEGGGVPGGAKQGVLKERLLEAARAKGAVKEIGKGETK